MVIWQYLAGLSIVFLLSGCATFEDERPIHIQKESLKQSTTLIQGVYTIKDSRNNTDKFKSVDAYFYDDDHAIVTFFTPNDKEYRVIANKCKSYFNESVTCNVENPDFTPYYAYGLTYFRIYKAFTAETRESGAMIGGFKPMHVNKNDYVIDLIEYNGRPHLFLLSK